MRHPDERRIALYAGGDGGWAGRVSIGQHLRRCNACRLMAAQYARDREALRSEADQIPAALNWNRLASEMTGNIRVGLAAGECVAGSRARQSVIKSLPIGWRPVAAAAGLALLLVSGWFLKFPAQDRESLARAFSRLSGRTEPVASAGISLQSTGNGIQVSENGSALTLMHPGSTAPVVVVSTRGSLGARYVDADTGQVTITNVYAQ